VDLSTRRPRERSTVSKQQCCVHSLCRSRSCVYPRELANSRERFSALAFASCSECFDCAVGVCSCGCVVVCFYLNPTVLVGTRGSALPNTARCVWATLASSSPHAGLNASMGLACVHEAVL